VADSNGLIKLRQAGSSQWTDWGFRDIYKYYFEAASLSGWEYSNGQALSRLMPLEVNANWYMNQGPGQFVDPATAPIFNFVSANAQALGTGTYGIRDLVNFYDQVNPSPAGANKRPDTFSYSSYAWSNGNYYNFSLADNITNSLIFGSTQFKITDGAVTINQNGTVSSIVVLKPFDDKFNLLTNHDNGPWWQNALVNTSNAIDGFVYDGNDRVVPLRMAGEGRSYQIDSYPDLNLQSTSPVIVGVNSQQGHSSRPQTHNQ
jgi:hypothetical protein